MERECYECGADLDSGCCSHICLCGNFCDDPVKAAQNEKELKEYYEKSSRHTEC